MNLFFKRLSIFLSIFFAITGSYLYLIYCHPELVDEVYYRFTTPKSGSLIIGTSRAAVGIMPSVMNKELFNGENEIINHSFTFGTSNYGPKYLKEIKQKIKIENGRKGTFIVAVDPWGLSINTGDPDDTTSFIEIKRHVFVGGLQSSSVNPNFEYLKKFWGNKFYPIIVLAKKAVKYDGLWLVTRDGWMDINVKTDPSTMKQRIQKGLNDYKKNNNMQLSETRFKYLEEIIKFLQTEGTVYMVRMPVTSEMRELENERFPKFAAKISDVVKKYNVRFFDFINTDGYNFVDVHHLEKHSAAKITLQICDSIRSAKQLSIN